MAMMMMMSSLCFFSQQLPSFSLSSLSIARKVREFYNRSENWHSATRYGRQVSFKGSVKFVQTSCRISAPGTLPIDGQKDTSNVIRDKVVPDADPPRTKDVNG